MFTLTGNFQIFTWRGSSPRIWAYPLSYRQHHLASAAPSRECVRRMCQCSQTQPSWQWELHRIADKRTNTSCHQTQKSTRKDGECGHNINKVICPWKTKRLYLELHCSKQCRNCSRYISHIKVMEFVSRWGIYKHQKHSSKLLGRNKTEFKFNYRNFKHGQSWLFSVRKKIEHSHMLLDLPLGMLNLLHLSPLCTHPHSPVCSQASLSLSAERWTLAALMSLSKNSLLIYLGMHTRTHNSVLVKAVCWLKDKMKDITKYNVKTHSHYYI